MLDVTRAYDLDFLFPKNDGAVGLFLKTYGQFAPAEVDLFSAYMETMKPGTVLDLGGNIGCVSLPIAKRFPDWSVITVEGHRGLSQVLSANAFANHLYNVQVVRAAVGAAEGVIDFPEPPLSSQGNFGTLSLAKTSEFATTRILMQSVDALAPSDTRLIKIDLEGYEIEALRGATKTLAEVRPILLLESNPIFGPSAREANALLMSSGYRLFAFFSPAAHVTDPPKRAATRAPKEGDDSVLALPPGAPNLWDLPAILTPDQPKVTDAGQFKYLGRYGYRVGG